MGSDSGTAATETSLKATQSQPTPKPKQRLEPMLHSLLKACILLGIGVIAGYGLFHSIFRYRCTDVLQDMERGYNRSIASLSGLYQKSVENHKQCLAGESKAHEIAELRGRLEAQSDLVASHRSLLQKHQVSASRLQEIEQQLQEKEAEFFIIQKRIDLRNQEKNELEEVLQELKQTIEVELGEKTKTIESLQSSVQAFQMTEREMLEHVQSRHAVMTRQFFGKGPYYVKFALDIPGHSETFFVAEITSRKKFPLSVFTFLTLVESGFYNDLHIANDGNGVVAVGSGSADSDSVLAEKLQGLGFLAGSSLYFPEVSPEVPCGPNTLGFVERGPALHLHLSSGREGGKHPSCFAEVVRGTEILGLVHESGETIRIMSASVLLSDSDGEGTADL